jgi:triosephosphate isomerase
MYPEARGAYTGEASPTMLLDLGCSMSSSDTANDEPAWAIGNALHHETLEQALEALTVI